jgi:hypothetical protein
VDKLSVDFLNLKEIFLSNKIGQGVELTWMEEVVVLGIWYGSNSNKIIISCGK